MLISLICNSLNFRQYSIDFIGNPEKCFILLNLSSSAAARSSPSFKMAAEASAWYALIPKIINSHSLILKWPDRPKEIYRTGMGNLSEAAVLHTRVPAGHPEGYIEAFANIYRNFARAVSNYKEGKKPDPKVDFPGVHEGVRGMLFLEKVVESSSDSQKWVELKE